MKNKQSEFVIIEECFNREHFSENDYEYDDLGYYIFIKTSNEIINKNKIIRFFEFKSRKGNRFTEIILENNVSCYTAWSKEKVLDVVKGENKNEIYKNR